MHFDILELVHGVDVPVGVHLVELPQIVLYHVYLQGNESVMLSRELMLVTYISEDLHGEALWDEDCVAELAADMP